LYDALHESRIVHVLARHEQGAGFIAQGMARVTGRAAVCLGTSGPGATNLVTAIADAKLDSIPLVAITGQVPRALLGTDAFQEVDTFAMTLPITKHNFMVMETRDLLTVIPRAFEIAESGRPGPVVVDIPKDVLTGVVEVEEWPEPGRGTPLQTCDEGAIARLAEMIGAAERPVFYIGGGVIASNAGTEVLALAERIGAPIASTLMALGAVPARHPASLGMLGMHAARSTNMILDEADLLIAVGARFDDRATGKAAEFCKHALIAHIDIDPSEIGKIKPANLAINADAGVALKALLRYFPASYTQRRTAWMERVAELKARYPLQMQGAGAFHPLEFCRLLGELLPDDAIITTDVGQHQMWMAQGYPFRQARTWLTSGGLGTMGFGLPAAIGAALAEPGRRVVCVSGDGSILMNIQELVTLTELNLNVTTIVLNNAHLGMVRQQQELFYGGRYSQSRFHAQPDLAAAARAFGVRGYRVDSDAGRECVEQVLRQALAEPGPSLVDLEIHEHEMVYPMVPPGAANREMICQQTLIR